ncbi:MAG: ATP-binding protein [Bacteroidota bacterium]
MILIVDDRPENIFSLKSILELHSFAVDTAGSGDEALTKTLKNNYSLIILDVQMPGMDGFEVAEFLSGNNRTRDIPLIFLSAVNTEKKFITKGYASGAVDYIVKPIDTDILLLKVKTLHRLYEQHSQLLTTQAKLESEITFRIIAEAEIREKARELHGILASIPQVAFTATALGEIDYVNERWYDYSPSLEKFPGVCPGDPVISDQWKKMLGGTSALELETRIGKLDSNDFRYHLLRVVPVAEHGKVIRWVGTFTDIEEQKQVEKKKDEFLSIASHELKTPLTSIKGYLQIMDKVLTEDGKTRAFAERALNQVNKLDGLINDLLDVSKIENGELKFDLHELNFEELVASTLDMLRQIYPAVTIEHNNTVDAWTRGNALRLEQVIINFISNAIKYTPSCTRLSVITRVTEEGNLYFGVQDAGIGISAENQEKIFGKFFRVSESAARAQGLGIGLYICAEILNRHDAKFGVQSEPGKGSLFYFTLPLIVKE